MKKQHILIDHLHASLAYMVQRQRQPHCRQCYSREHHKHINMANNAIIHKNLTNSIR